MRKLLLSVCCMLFMAGVVVAAEVAFVKYNKDTKEVTVKEGEKEATYKLTDKTKITVTDKDGKATEGKLDEFIKRLESDKGAPKKLDIVTEKGEITEVKLKKGGKGK